MCKILLNFVVEGHPFMRFVLVHQSLKPIVPILIIGSTSCIPRLLLENNVGCNP